VENLGHSVQKKKKEGIFSFKFPVFKKILKKLPQSAYNMKGCLRLSTFIFAIRPNLANYTYGQLPFEQHHKIEKKRKNTAVQ
jgi:hypothetical protein